MFIMTCIIASIFLPIIILLVELIKDSVDGSVSSGSSSSYTSSSYTSSSSYTPKSSYSDIFSKEFEERRLKRGLEDARKDELNRAFYAHLDEVREWNRRIDAQKSAESMASYNAMCRANQASNDMERALFQAQAQAHDDNMRILEAQKRNY